MRKKTQLCCIHWLFTGNRLSSWAHWSLSVEISWKSVILSLFGKATYLKLNFLLKLIYASKKKTHRLFQNANQLSTKKAQKIPPQPHCQWGKVKPQRNNLLSWLNKHSHAHIRKPWSNTHPGRQTDGGDGLLSDLLREAFPVGKWDIKNHRKGGKKNVPNVDYWKIVHRRWAKKGMSGLWILVDFYHELIEKKIFKKN